MSNDFTGQTVKRTYRFTGGDSVDVTLIDNEIALAYRDDCPNDVIELYENSATVSNTVFLFDNPKQAFDFAMLCLFAKAFTRSYAQEIEQHVRNTR